MRRLAPLTAVLALVVGATAALAVVRSGSGEGGNASPHAQPAAPEPAAGPKAQAHSPIPKLTADDRAKTRRIVARDPDLKRIVGNHAYSFKRIGPWTTARIRRRGMEVKIGTVSELAVKPPVDVVEAEWPLIVYDPKERSYPPFRQKRVRLRVHGLKQLMVNVDLRRGFVVSIEPGIGAGIETPPGAPPPQPPPGPSD